MDSLLKKVRGLYRFAKTRTFAVGVLSAVLAVMVFQISTRTNAVYIRDGENVTLEFTVEQDMENILENNGITTLAYDEVDFTGFQGKMAQINITRAFPVHVTADGLTQQLMVTEGTVADALEQASVSYDTNDLLSLGVDKPLKENDQIVLERVEYGTRIEPEEIPFEVEYKLSSLLPIGRTKVLQAGKTGMKEHTFVQRTVDGALEEEQLLGTNTVHQPVTQVILKGAVEPVSPMDFGYSFDENGVPMGAKQVLTNQVATGYSARPGAKTASGRYAIPGHVAVDPSVIPYGTKMYIASPDGKFIYGFAIAADTGIGLLNGVVDVDLFYDTYKESALNGRKNVSIYILE